MLPGKEPSSPHGQGRAQGGGKGQEGGLGPQSPDLATLGGGQQKADAVLEMQPLEGVSDPGFLSQVPSPGKDN